MPAVPGPCPSCGAVEWAEPPGSPVAADADARLVDRTRLGLLLLAVGVVASLLPVGAILGDLLVLVGGLLLVTSSAPFGPTHRRNATLGLVLGFGGGIGAAAAAVVLPLSLPPLPTASSQVPAWVQSVETSVSVSLATTLLLGIVSALGLVLITYSLQDRAGRVCLWLALGLGVALSAALYVFILQALQTLLAEAMAGQGLDAALLAATFSELGWFAYLGIIPNALFAGSFFLADTRIRRGFIPATGPRSPSE